MTRLCSTCLLAAPFPHFNSCLQCEVASIIADDEDYMTLARKLYAGTDWLAQVEREYARQMSALIACGYVGERRAAL